MICSKCGREIPDGRRFCVQCGAPLNTDVQINMPPQPVMPPVQPVAVPVQAVPIQKAPYDPTEYHLAKSGSVMGIVGFSLCFFFSLIGIVLATFSLINCADYCKHYPAGRYRVGGGRVFAILALVFGVLIFALHVYLVYRLGIKINL